MGTARVKKAPATPKRRTSEAAKAAKAKAKRPAASPQTGASPNGGQRWSNVAGGGSWNMNGIYGWFFSSWLMMVNSD